MKDKSEYAARMAAKLQAAMKAGRAQKAYKAGKLPPRGSKLQHLPRLKRAAGARPFDVASFRRGEGPAE